MIIEVTVALHAYTDKAYLVSDDGTKEKAQWVPISQIEAERDLGDGMYELSLPEWLAYDKGLI